jgi:predicted ribosome quality control (RQC) complex YloA/Tae2 family protein
VNFTTLSSIVDELSCLISRARVTRVFEDIYKNIILVLSAGKKDDRFLLISPDRALPRFHLVAEKPASRGSLSPFTLYLKSRAAGGRIEQIGLLNEDRIVQIVFSRQGVKSQLIFEVLGHSNLIITDPSGMIRSVYYPVSLTEHNPRPLLPGLNYVLPAKKAFHHGGKNAGIGRRCSNAAAGAEDHDAANREAESLYDRTAAQKRFESSRSRLRSLARKLFDRAGRKLSALGNDLNEAQESENYKRAGDLILENLKELRPGLKMAVLSGDGGRTTEIRLDPRRSPSQNAEMYYKKYKKAKTGMKIIAQMLNQTRGEISFLQGVLSDLEAAESESQLLSCRSLLQEKGYLHSIAAKGPKSAPPALFRKIIYCDWEIIIGKSAAGNDYITTRMAQSHDLWFHAEGMPGSHVLVRNPEAREIPVDVVEKAASLAAFYSKGRSGGKVPVTYTFARFVKKPRGAKPGLVALLERRTIMTIPSEEEKTK